MFWLTKEHSNIAERRGAETLNILLDFSIQKEIFKLDFRKCYINSKYSLQDDLCKKMNALDSLNSI